MQNTATVEAAPEVLYCRPAHGRQRLNQSFFDTWTPESAWVLGWALSDGYITNIVLDFKIHKRDAEILYKIKELLSASVPVRRVPRKQAVRLQLYSRKLLSACHKLANSYTTMPKVCLGHFIRGFFEGDGSVIKLNRKGAEVCFDNGNYELLTNLWSLLRHNETVTGGAIRRDKRGQDWQLRFRRRYDCYQLYHLMYGVEPSFYLTRKKRRFEELMGNYLNQLPIIGGAYANCR